MRRSPQIGAVRRRVAGATVLAVLLSVTGPAGTVGGAPATVENLQAWHLKLVKETPPEGGGCFTARYPTLVWLERACAPATSGPMLPRTTEQAPPPVSDPVPLVVGGNAHFVAETPDPTKPIVQAFGTFDEARNMDTVKTVNPLTGVVTDGAYSLQLNTNFFSTPACADATVPANCQGWMQFVFANQPGGAELFIEYWLRRYDKACPTGWTPWNYGTGNTDCFIKTPPSTLASVPVGRLDEMELSGDVQGPVPVASLRVGQDVTFNVGSTTDLVKIGANWKQAEFNVFGNGFASEAQFPANAYSKVRTRINYGGTAAPVCVEAGFTSESNNLNYGSKPTKQGVGPALLFEQHSDPNLPFGDFDCDVAEVVGDTHQVTFAGTLYDFQASGDFVEAQVGTGFEVHTRKVSGAPTWPNASVNRSAAVRMGNTTVAVCEGTRLVVDGTPTFVPPGGGLTLPSGVTIRRSGNVHDVKDPAGNALRTELRPSALGTSYLDVRVGLGRSPVAVRGLLGNPGGDPWQLEARDGTRFRVPVPFTTLYNTFGNSWRLSGPASMLAPCASVPAANPTAPFYASNLPTEVRQQAEYACLTAGVSQAWLDTCTLDVAVLGRNAATIFTRRQPPVVNGNPPPCIPGPRPCLLVGRQSS
ncbi:hypothetical protein ACQSSU_08810 [Micromonospora echinospora]